jgi:hypothetical protein
MTRIIYTCPECKKEYEVHFPTYGVRVKFFNSHSWEKDYQSFCSDECRSKWLHKLVDRLKITSIEVMREDYEAKMERE